MTTTPATTSSSAPWSGEFPTISDNKDALTLEEALEAFLRALEGKNRSVATRVAYRADVAQFIGWLHSSNIVATTPTDVTKTDISEYLAHLGQRGISGLSRARKLAAIREYFRFLEGHDHLTKSPTAGVDTPKKEKNIRTWLRPDEYSKMLSQAGASPRDFAILQVFLQTGIRVSELCHLTWEDVDFTGKTIRVTGKGMVTRDIDLVKKAIKALQNYQEVRPQVADSHVFLNYQGEPLSERSVQELVKKYREMAGITKKATPHSFRHTCFTYKAIAGMSPFQIQELAGHASIATTQIYVHIKESQNAKKVMEATSL